MRGHDADPLPDPHSGYREVGDVEVSSVDPVGESAYGPDHDGDVLESGPAGPPRRDRVPSSGRPGRHGLSLAPRFQRLRRLARSHRPIVAGLAVALLLGAGTGYLAGYHRLRLPTVSPRAGSTGPSPAPPSVMELLPSAVTGTGRRCAMQVGNQLQLGVEVVNRSGSTATLVEIAATLPLAGLRATASAWGSCGQLPRTSPGDGPTPVSLDAGATTWLTMTFDVLVPCPAPIPVMLSLRYTLAGHGNIADLPSFPDLGDVPYAGCSASPS